MVETVLKSDKGERGEHEERSRFYPINNVRSGATIKSAARATSRRVGGRAAEARGPGGPRAGPARPTRENGDSTRRGDVAESICRSSRGLFIIYGNDPWKFTVRAVGPRGAAGLLVMQIPPPRGSCAFVFKSVPNNKSEFNNANSIFIRDDTAFRMGDGLRRRRDGRRRYCCILKYELFTERGPLRGLGNRLTAERCVPKLSTPAECELREGG
ncbi:hypothetical protein EVAR_37936_1 [Eumeta japonica]|uniref:Uncharacterized protein n=1 Tax=Eumeta variegata TaxID=151549 RepID=A0A4C1XGS1_EUMVA|nr:hypothetical protein EVAR_37936_1 [Eumeta japonica]